MKPTPKTREDRAWLQGYAAALGCAVRGFGETSLAREMMAADGLDLGDFRKARVEAYDMRAIKRARGGRSER